MLDTGSETVLTHSDGEKYTVSKMHLPKVSRLFCQWIRDQLVDPVESMPKALFEALPIEEQIQRYKEAESIKRQLGCFTLTCDLAQQFLKTETGAIKLFQLMLLHHHPDMTEEKAGEIAMAAGDQVAAAMERSQGSMASLGNGEARSRATSR